MKEIDEPPTDIEVAEVLSLALETMSFDAVMVIRRLCFQRDRLLCLLNVEDAPCGTTAAAHGAVGNRYGGNP